MIASGKRPTLITDTGPSAAMKYPGAIILSAGMVRKVFSIWRSMLTGQVVFQSLSLFCYLDQPSYGDSGNPRHVSYVHVSVIAHSQVS